MTASQFRTSLFCSKLCKTLFFILTDPPEPTIEHKGKSIIFYDGDVDQKLICKVVVDSNTAPLTPTLNWAANSVSCKDNEKFLNMIIKHNNDIHQFISYEDTQGSIFLTFC